MQKMVEFGPALKKYFTTWNFQGRSSRSEYWWPMLAVFIGTCIPILGILVGLASIIPSICVFVRRMHDIGKSGWWFWLGLIPFVGPIVLIILCCQQSQMQDNEYGAVPNTAD